MFRDHRQPVLEGLEPRALLSTFVVANSNDTGVGSLRQMIADANAAAGADVIEFDSSLDGATIGLTSGEITITGDLTINGFGEDRLTISGQRISRVFGVSANATVSINDLTIKWGQQDNGLGGQIYVDQDATLTLTSVTLHDSQALWGGAVYNNFGSLTLDSCTVSEGKAFRNGGGIDSNGLLTIVDSSFVNNYASIDGGAVHGSGGYDGVTEISGSTFSGNVASGNGGAITNLATMIIKNSTISGNQANGAGGAIYNGYTLSLTIYNSTIVENTASDTGGIVNVGATATLYSTILSLNTGGDHTPGTVDGSNNYLGGDPLLEPLADNGGPTLTRALPAGSPAAGNGSNPLGLEFDQRGAPYARSFAGAIDIGALQRQPVTQVVDTISDIDNGDYSAGDLSLREAISRSNSDPTVYPTITFDPSLNDVTITLTNGALTISSSVEIHGPGRNLLRVFANYGSRLLYISGGEVSIGGMAFDAGSSDQGGAIYAASSRLSLTDVGILNSRATGHGGGLYVAAGEVTITDSVINSNTASNGGGGIFAQVGTLTINNTRITANSASFAGGVGSEGALTLNGCTVDGNSAAGSGGGIENRNLQSGVADLRITDSTITNNSAGESGGGVRIFNGRLTITGSTIIGNEAIGPGGGVHGEQAGTSVWIATSRISSNTAAGGGGIYVADGTLVLDRSEVSSNHSRQDGGGIRLLSVTQALMLNSTISGNTADNWGGGIATFTLSAAAYSITFATIARNTSDYNRDRTEGYEAGGGVHVDGGTMTIFCTIVDENYTGASRNDISGTLLSPVSSNNLVGDGSSAGGLSVSNGNLIGVSAQLGALEDNGGPTRTHALPEGSPAIDAGVIQEGLATDQRGEARSSGDGPDIGAFEKQVSQGGGGFAADVINGGAVRTTAVAGGMTLSTARNTDGDLIVFTGSGSAWTVLRLIDYTSAPAATGDPIIWTDPNDGLAYVAAPSADGFLLFRRAADGAWTYRDIAGGAGDPADRPGDSLAYFVTRPKTGSPLVYIVGSNDAGELVAYFQTSPSKTGQQASWSFYNITDDLTSQGMTTPVFSASPTTYVTGWNQWTIAGLDGQGHVQGVWVNIATFTTWRVDDLSAITGADPLAGRLDVTLTPWGGIRFAGSNPSGHLVGTWWNPGRGPGNWTQTDLTGQVNGNAPTLVPGHLTAWFVGSNNMISYAGYDDGGDIVSLFWQPSDGGVWRADNLTDSLQNRSSRPTHELNAYVSSGGAVSLTGAGSDGSAVRLWAPDGSRDFVLENLSELATRI